ncbi:hypothetical protein ACSSVY_001971 [Roseovarius sp. MBR-51]
MPFRNGLVCPPQDTEAVHSLIGLIELGRPDCILLGVPRSLGLGVVVIGAASSPRHPLSMVRAEERLDGRMAKRSECSARFEGPEKRPKNKRQSGHLKREEN